MNNALFIVISSIANIFSLLIIVDVILSWILPPMHPARETFGRILQPIYSPIRRIVPPLGGMDFSPIILLIVIQVIVQIAATILRR